MKFGQMLLEDGVISNIPFVGCVYTAGKMVIGGIEDVYTETGKFWKNSGKNVLSTILSCGGDALGVGAIAKCAVAVANFTWSAMNAGWGRDECMGGDGQTKDTQGAYSWDPNEMIGPSGYDDDKHFIKPIHNMSYMVTYENKAEATAPANEVFIRDTLDVAKYDLSTFSFVGYGWNNQSYSVGGSQTKEFTCDVPYQVNGNEIIVRVSGQFDEETGIATWSFVSLDKNGKELQYIMQGFLPPNNADGIGEGFVTFSVEHKANPANGSSISNKATIVFDYNKPIETNTYVNTFDTDYPTSQITGVTRNGSKMTVKFEGSDATSGIESYNLYGFTDGSEYELLFSGIVGNEFEFETEGKPTKGLCMIAKDNVGWFEPKDIKPEYLQGDANGDGVVNKKDLKAIANYIVTGNAKGINLMNADANGDQKVNVVDIVFIIGKK